MALLPISKTIRRRPGRLVEFNILSRPADNRIHCWPWFYRWFLPRCDRLVSFFRRSHDPLRPAPLVVSDRPLRCSLSAFQGPIFHDRRTVQRRYLIRQSNPCLETVAPPLHFRHCGRRSFSDLDASHQLARGSTRIPLSRTKTFPQPSNRLLVFWKLALPPKPRPLAQRRLAILARNSRQSAFNRAPRCSIVASGQSPSKTLAGGSLHHNTRLYAPGPRALALLPDVLPRSRFALRKHFGPVGKLLGSGNASELA